MVNVTRIVAPFTKMEYAVNTRAGFVKLGTECTCPYSFESTVLRNCSSDVMLNRIVTQLAEVVQTSTSAVTPPMFCRLLYMKARLIYDFIAFISLIFFLYVERRHYRGVNVSWVMKHKLDLLELWFLCFWATQEF